MSEEKAQKASSERDESASDDGSDDEEEEDEEPVESLVTGREKRATAGNRLSSLLDKEAKDDIDLLFAENEEEEDVEFEEEEVDASDAEIESSSDEEDQGPTKGDDELEGEKELQKQDRLERKKRKAQDVFNKPGGLRKRVKIDPTATPAPGTPDTPAPRQKKKSERVSWVPTPADAPTRISSRKQTVKNREVVHKRLVDSEQQRIKIMRQMEAAQKRKDAQRVKPMTQAEKMEEAAKTERKNAKSLNRWEEAEKKRAEEQKAKLEALHNRQLTGPAVSMWSGLAHWVNGKIRQVGVREIREAGHKEHLVKPIGNKHDLPVQQQLPLPPPRLVTNVDQDTVMSGTLQPSPQLQQPGHPASQYGYPGPPTTYAPPQAPPQGPPGFLDGIHAYAALPVQMKQPEFTGTADGGFQASAAHAAVAPGPFVRPPYPLPPPSPKVVVPVDEYSSRNLVALKNIDANASRLPELQDNVLLKKQKGKLQSKNICLRKSDGAIDANSHDRAGPRILCHHITASQIP